jgi:hypothetical protein
VLLFLAYWLLPESDMETKDDEAVPAKMRYASILRCIGQSLEAMDLKSIEVKSRGDDFIVQAWNRGTSMAMDLEKHYSLKDLRKLDAEGRKRRKPFTGPPSLLSLSLILRFAGNYIDRIGGRLLRVSWQDQSDKIQSVTVQWQAVEPGRETKESQTATIEELCFHIYKQRKKINLASERQAHRPFVSVGRVP